MKIGYFKLKRGDSRRRIQEELHCLGASVFFVEESTTFDSWEQSEELAEALSMAKSGDTLMIYRLEDISWQPEKWLTFIDQLTTLGIEIEINKYTSISLEERTQLMKWMQDIPKYVSSDVKIISIQTETEEDKEYYRAFMSNSQGRKTYWKVVNHLLSGISIRRTSRRCHVSRGTTYRIKKQVQRAKQVLVMVGVFIVTMVGFQIARYYTDNIFIQFLIGSFATIALSYFIYSDSQEEQEH